MKSYGKYFLLVITALCLWTARAESAVFLPTSFTLSNGLQVVVVTNDLAPVVSQMVWYKVGSSDDPPGKSGLAHYLEHLMFRGTTNVPAGRFSEVIAEQGGISNAFTSRDYTAYYEEISSDRLPMIMQMEADRMANLLIEEETAKQELRVVQDERRQRTENDPEGIFMEKLANHFSPGHPYGIPVIGWMKDIKRLTAKDAKKFYKSYYAPNNAVVIISGDVKVEDVMRLAAATYGRIEKRDNPKRKPIPPQPNPSIRSFDFRDHRVKQAEIAIKISTPSYNTQSGTEAYAYEVLANVLSDGSVGLLYSKLVDDLKLAVDVRTGYDPDVRGDAVFGISVVPRENISHKKVEKAILDTLRDIASKGIDFEKVSSSKNRLRRAAIFAREQPSTSGYAFGTAITTGRIVSDVEDWPERINAVDTHQVNSALAQLIANNKRIVAALLPEKHNKKSGNLVRHKNNKAIAR